MARPFLRPISERELSGRESILLSDSIVKPLFKSYGGDERPGLFGIQREKRKLAHGMQYILKPRTPLMKGGKHQ